MNGPFFHIPVMMPFSGMTNTIIIMMETGCNYDTTMMYS